jgi:hypothetical protein
MTFGCLSQVIKYLDQQVSVQEHQESGKHHGSTVYKKRTSLLPFLRICHEKVADFVSSRLQQNINNAYVSGMQEDLHLDGDQLNYFTTYFNVAYCIMLIPSQVILTWVRPSFWLPGLEILWGILTGLMALTTSAKQVYM